MKILVESSAYRSKAVYTTSNPGPMYLGTIGRTTVKLMIADDRKFLEWFKNLRVINKWIL